MQISLMWWNTSLSPAAKRDRSGPTERKAAYDLVQYFTHRLGFDVVALGEVSSSDIEQIQERCGKDYSVFDGQVRAGKTAFDTCVLYRSDRLHLIDQGTIANLDGGTTLKVGQWLRFLLPDLVTTLHVFVSHWPSRMWCHENHADRSRLGVLLRQAVVEALGQEKSGHVILLGDFNDEPFSESLEQQLYASRDRNLAARKGHLLYNPFWRHLGTATLHAPDSISNDTHGGSYCYHSGRVTRWHTFDQIIFSSAFLGNSAWHLVEDATKVLDVPPYTQLVKDRNSQFDHMPVMTIIEKES